MLITSIPQYIQGLTNAKLDLTTANATITLTLTNGTTVFSLFKVKAVAANTTVELLTRDLVLESAEILKATAATANRLHVVASIQEFTKQRITTSAII